MDYKKAYFHLFNSITDAIEELDKSGAMTKEIKSARQTLIMAQKYTEDLFAEKNQATAETPTSLR